MSFIPKFVINLKRRPDRLSLFQERCPLKDVCVIPAFDGHNHELESESDIKLYKKLTCSLLGERGVFVSHLRIYQEIVNEGHPYALIFEDDAEFCNEFLKRYENIIKELPEDFDLLYIGGRFSPEFVMSQSSSLPVSSNLVKYNFNIPWDGPAMDRTMHAYIISNSAAKRLVDEFTSIDSMDVPVDHWVIRHFTKETKQIYSASPLLCHSPMVGDSDIRGYKNTLRGTKITK